MKTTIMPFMLIFFFTSSSPLDHHPPLPVTMGAHINLRTVAIVGGLTLCADGLETLSAINRSTRRATLLSFNHSGPDPAVDLMIVNGLVKTAAGCAIAVIALTTFLYPE
jgi:hypothetical protein